MAGFHLWDTERSESIPAEDVQIADEMVYVVALSPDADATQAERRKRILSQDFALLELQDGTTTLVELMDDRSGSPVDVATSLMTVRYLIVG